MGIDIKARLVEASHCNSIKLSDHDHEWPITRKLMGPPFKQTEIKSLQVNSSLVTQLGDVGSNWYQLEPF